MVLCYYCCLWGRPTVTCTISSFRLSPATLNTVHFCDKSIEISGTSFSGVLLLAEHCANTSVCGETYLSEYRNFYTRYQEMPYTL